MAGDGAAAADDPARYDQVPHVHLSRLATEAQLGKETESFLRQLMWRLSAKRLRRDDWKKLAKHWHFTDEHVRAIHCQYTGPTCSGSY